MCRVFHPTTALPGRVHAQSIRRPSERVCPVSRVAQSTSGSPFNALVQSVARARDMVAAAPSVPVNPWFAPRLGIWHECGASRCAYNVII